MKKSLLRTAALLMTFFLVMAGVTRIASATDKWTTGKVATIVVDTVGFVFTLEGGLRLCDSASGGGTDWVTISPNYFSAEQVRNYLSIVTAAKLAGREVQVRGVNSNEPNEWGCRTDGLDLY